MTLGNNWTSGTSKTSFLYRIQMKSLALAARRLHETYLSSDALSVFERWWDELETDTVQIAIQWSVQSQVVRVMCVHWLFVCMLVGADMRDAFELCYPFL